MLKAFLLVGMPIYLFLAEQAMKLLLVEPVAISAAGASIAAAGLSLLIPVIIPRRVPIIQSDALKASFAAQKIVWDDIRIRNRRDDRVTEAALIALFLLAPAWCWTLYLVHTQRFYTALIVGILCYSVGIVFTWWKERI